MFKKNLMNTIDTSVNEKVQTSCESNVKKYSNIVLISSATSFLTDFMKIFLYAFNKRAVKLKKILKKINKKNPIA